MIRSLLGVGDGVILAMIYLTRPCGLRMRTVLINLGLGAGRYTDMPNLMPQLLRIKCGLLKNIHFSKKLLPAGRQRVGTVDRNSIGGAMTSSAGRMCRLRAYDSALVSHRLDEYHRDPYRRNGRPSCLGDVKNFSAGFVERTSRRLKRGVWNDAVWTSH